MDDGTPIEDLMFEMKMQVCESFPSVTPFSIRREKAVDFYTFIIKYSKYAKRKKKNEGKSKIIRRPAGDTWF